MKNLIEAQRFSLHRSFTSKLPWKKELHDQESALDKKFREETSMEEKKEREKEREGSTKLKEEKRERS